MEPLEYPLSEDETIRASQPVTGPLVALFVVVRTGINASYRMIYPFLKAFASGMGISLQAAASLSPAGRWWAWPVRC